ncbi:MAG: Mu transposase C-terminal domain-containing protein [Solirubrobacterales bacterium]
MTDLTSTEERDLVIKRLLERREHFGELTRNEVAKAAMSCGVSQSTMYKWLIAGKSPSRKRPNYQLNENDIDAFYLASGDAANAFVMLNRSPGPTPPSLSTYRRAIRRELSEAEIAGARHGARAVRQKQIALHGKTYRRNERWEADHKRLEIEVIPPGHTQPSIPWVTWLIDVGTRYIGGWAISLRPTRGEVLSIIRQGVESRPEKGPLHGVPDTIVWDNGLEFTAKAVAQCAQMLGSYPFAVFPYSPEKKPMIERVNQTVEVELLKSLPFYTEGPRKKDGTLYGGPAGRISLQRFVLEFREWVDYYNFERPHSGIGGQSPLEAWKADPTPLRTVSEADLHRLTLERQLKVVSHDGGVHVNTHVFTHPKLSRFTGRKVEVGMLPHDYSLAEIFVADEWLCTATPTGKQSPEQVAAHQAEQKVERAKITKRIRRADRIEEARFAGMTPDDPTPRLLPPRKPIKLPDKHRDIMGFGDEIGTVDREGLDD